MSIKHAMAVRDSGLLKGALYMVATALAYKTNEEGVCWPGVALLAFDSRLSERAVRKATQELRRRSLLSVDRGIRKTNSYRLNLTLFEEATRTRRQHLEADLAPLAPRHLRKNGQPDLRHNLPNQGNRKAGTAEPTSPNTKEDINNLNRARRIDENADDILAILDVTWDWKAEEQFMVLAQTIIGSHATEGWFRHGTPRYVIFAEPVHSHGRRAEGLGISWADESVIPAGIEKVMQTLGFDQNAIWPWSKFVARLESERLPPIQPTRPSRLTLGTPD